GASEALPTSKPLIEPAPPAFRTESSQPRTVRLIGRSPPEETVSSRSSPPGRTAKSEIESLPALTAKSRRPSPERTTAPCEPRPAPLPSPPVANEPSGVSEPSAARANASTALPAGELVSVYTAPGSSSELRAPAVAAAASAASSATVGKSSRKRRFISGPPVGWGLVTPLPTREEAQRYAEPLF